MGRGLTLAVYVSMSTGAAGVCSHGHNLMDCKSPVYYPGSSQIWQLKSTSQRQGRKGDRASERSRSANLRANGQETHIRPNPLASQHNMTKPVWGFLGRVNEVVVQGRIMFLPGEICQPKLIHWSGGTEPAKVRVNMTEVSRRREPVNTVLWEGAARGVPYPDYVFSCNPIHCFPMNVSITFLKGYRIFVLFFVFP